VQNDEEVDAQPARKCGPLEFFPLHTLYVGGYVRVNDRFFALIESPDGVMRLARVGDYMGQDFGRINDINHAGVTLREFISDAHNEYHDVSTLLDFGARPSATASSRAEHAEVGSPLREYSTSLGVLFSGIRFPAELSVVCLRRYPASESVIKTGLSRWRSQNGSVLKEIDRHVSAYMERHSQRTGESAALVEKKYQGEVSRLTENLFRQWDEDSEEYLRDRCQDYGPGLSGLEYDLERRYKVELGVLRKCAAAATCPNLREQ